MHLSPNIYRPRYVTRAPRHWVLHTCWESIVFLLGLSKFIATTLDPVRICHNFISHCNSDLNQPWVSVICNSTFETAHIHIISGRHIWVCQVHSSLWWAWWALKHSQALSNCSPIFPDLWSLLPLIFGASSLPLNQLALLQRSTASFSQHSQASSWNGRSYTLITTFPNILETEIFRTFHRYPLLQRPLSLGWSGDHVLLALVQSSGAWVFLLTILQWVVRINGNSPEYWLYRFGLSKPDTQLPDICIRTWVSYICCCLFVKTFTPYHELAGCKDRNVFTCHPVSWASWLQKSFAPPWADRLQGQ